MSDPSGSNSSSASTTATAAPTTSSSAELHAQAVRFLTSVRARGAASESEQRDFLRSKGLSDDAIEAALSDARRPAASGSQLALPSPAEAAEDDGQAWERAARAFNDPIHADPESVRAPALPGKTYPRSPLALYHDAAAAAAARQQGGTMGGVQQKLTRYQVLLKFFRTFSYMLVLGGGISAVAVALYRAYLLPRLTKTLDARSQLLKHHHELYTTLLTRLRTLGANSLSPCAVPATPEDAAAAAELNGEEAKEAAKRRGVLKRVQFADEKEGGSLELAGSADEKKPEDGAGATATTEKDAIKGALKKEVADGDVEAEASAADAEGEATIEPIYLFDGLKTSLASLSAALRADVSARAIGTPLTAPRASSSTSPSNTFSLLPPKSLAASVADASGESGTDSWEDTEADSDGLEFDPFAPVPGSKSRHSSTRRRKHSPAPPSSSAASGGAVQKDATAELATKLGSLNAFVHAQSFLSASTPSRWATIGAASAASHTAAARGAGSGNASASGGETSGGEGVAKPADVAQIKAEIRSLKGLLLSRRNFPSYARPPAARAPETPA